MSAQRVLFLAIIWLATSSPLSAQDPKLRATLKGTGAIYVVAFSLDGKTLASASSDMTIKLWDVATGKERRSLGRNGVVRSVAFSPDGRTLALASDEAVNLWDVANGKEPATLDWHTAVKAVAFSLDGKSLASASGDKTVKLWDVANGKEQATLRGHTQLVWSVAFSPDGKTLASASSDMTIKLWDVATGKERATLQGHSGNVLSVAFSPDGKTMASASEDKTIKIWEATTDKERATLQGHSINVLSVAFSPDGKALASASGDHLTLWDVATGKERASLQGHTDWVISVTFSPDGKMLASGSWDKTVKLWDVPAAHPSDRPAKPTDRTSLSPMELGVLWATLAEDDSGKAYEAMRTLLVAPREAISLIKERLRPAREPDILRLIKDLDSGQFAVRLKAREELQRWSERAEPALRQKLAEKPALEVGRQIEDLLTKSTNRQLHPEVLREIRAVEMLEHLASPEAKAVLETLATGAKGSRLTLEAQASLHRLSRWAAVQQPTEKP